MHLLGYAEHPGNSNRVGLRLYTATPSDLERVVPSSVSKNGGLDESFDLMGYALPPGTVIATQSWSMHRDPAIFPSPDSFIPERWLQGPDATEKMARYLMPFGTGSRHCGGMNLAYMMLRIIVAALIRNFNVAAPPETNERSMEIKDAFVSLSAWPVGLYSGNSSPRLSSQPPWSASSPFTPVTN